MQIERPPRWTKFSIPLQQAGVRKYDCVKARYFRLPKNINTGSNVYINSVKSSFRLHTLVLIQKENSLISLSKIYKGRYIYKIFCALVSNVCISFVVIDRTFGSAELFGQTSTVRFGPNDRPFFCRTQNFFSQQPFIFLFCLTTHMYAALSLVFR